MNHCCVQPQDNIKEPCTQLAFTARKITCNCLVHSAERHYSVLVALGICILLSEGKVDLASREAH